MSGIKLLKINQLHHWNVSPKEAVKIQKSLADKILIRPRPAHLNYIAGADIAYNKRSNYFFAAVVILDYSTLETVEIQTASGISTFPYISGLLSFREIPLLIKCFEKISIIPDVVMCDSQGYAHPRRFGLACHLGLLLNLPTIGCAKSRLIGDGKLPDYRKGNYTDLIDKNELIGAILRSKDNTNPLFISPGHLININKSVEIVLKSCVRYRIPEPTRRAHIEVNRVRVESNETKI